MALDVIGAGFGRTGTSSLKGALELLGFSPCHHMVEIFSHPEEVPVWDAAARGEKIDWDALFANYRASCDWPSCAFYQELAAHYPKAKLILTLRDSKAWYKSISSTILPSMKQGGRLPGIFGPLLIGEKTFGNDFSEAHMIDVYERHNEEVKRVIPANRLLVFEASDGWEPLCEFLGVAVPDVPYPKTNTTEEFKARIAAMQAGKKH